MTEGCCKQTKILASCCTYQAQKSPLDYFLKLSKVLLHELQLLAPAQTEVISLRQPRGRITNSKWELELHAPMHQT
jgi:hypothetical protein